LVVAGVHGGRQRLTAAMDNGNGGAIDVGTIDGGG
jgi:hypothetical protein